MKTFFYRLKCYVVYFITWISYFFATRFVFFMFYFEKTKKIGFGEAFKTFFYGFKLDCSSVGYISVIPFLLFFVSIFVNNKIITKVLKIYTFIFVSVLTFLFLMDLNLYGFWGNRIDETILMYFHTPKVMLASVTIVQLLGGFVFLISISFAVCYVFNKIINKISENMQLGKLWELPFFLILTVALIIPIRGGLQTIPINLSSVYFSNNTFANHSSINYAWNFINTIVHKSDSENKYMSFDKEVAEKLIENRISELRTEPSDSILNIEKPNVLIIIWESLSAKAVGALNDTINATPELTKLANSGLLFTNFYGNGNRTDKGIPAVLSGYYPQPTASIMKMVRKSNKLPQLSNEFKKMGYYNTYYYGGDMGFGNMKTYISSGKFDRAIDGDEFDKEDWNSKWGAYDHIVFERVQKDLSTQKQPFFTTFMTLTSHEPYELPDGCEFKFGKETEVQKHLSSYAYTDESLGNFIKNAKKTNWWKNTLIIILADHGHPLPKHKGEFNSPIRYQIPMVWTGGALKKHGTIDNFGGQVDLSYTLLRLLNADTSDFIFGKNIFENSDKQYAYYNFNNGFGIIDKNGVFVYDFSGKKSIVKQGDYHALDSLGKAITQEAFQDFIDK